MNVLYCRLSLSLSKKKKKKKVNNGTDCARPFYEGVERMLIDIYVYDDTPLKGA